VQRRKKRPNTEIEPAQAELRKVLQQIDWDHYVEPPLQKLRGVLLKEVSIASSHADEDDDDDEESRGRGKKSPKAKKVVKKRGVEDQLNEGLDDETFTRKVRQSSHCHGGSGGSGGL
jgi:hypothetical protein